MAENRFSSRFSPWPLGEFINLDDFKVKHKETVKFVQTCVGRRESWKTVREKLDKIKSAMDVATSSRTVENDAEFEKNRTLLSEYQEYELEVENYAIFLVINHSHALLVAVPQHRPLETVLKNTVKIVGNNNLANITVPIDVNESAGLCLEVENLDKRVELINDWKQLKFGSEIVRNWNVRDPSSIATIPCPISTTLYYHVCYSDKSRKAYKMCREHADDIHKFWNCGSRRYFISFTQASIRDIDLLALVAVFKRTSNVLVEMLKDDNALPVETLSAIYTATRSDCMEFAKTMCREFALEAGKNEGEINQLLQPQHVLDGPWASFEISSRNNASSGYTVGATSTSARFSGAS